MSADLIRKYTDQMEAARKKLTLTGKGAAGPEGLYAEAYKQLCKLDPIRYRPLRKKYSR